jgi:hypothetical protein
MVARAKPKSDMATTRSCDLRGGVSPDAILKGVSDKVGAATTRWGVAELTDPTRFQCANSGCCREKTSSAGREGSLGTKVSNAVFSDF